MGSKLCWLLPFAGFMMLAGCGSDESFVTRDPIVNEPVELTVLERDLVSQLCFAAEDGLVSISPMLGYTSGSLEDLLEVQCLVERSVDTLSVSASMRVEHPSDAILTSDLNPVFAFCDPLELEPGEYSIKYDTFGGPSNGTLVVEDDAFANGCFDEESGLNRVTLSPGIECVGRPLDPARGCFGAPEEVGTMAFDSNAKRRDEPSAFEDPSGTCYRFEELCRPESWNSSPRCSPADSSAEVCDEN